MGAESYRGDIGRNQRPEVGPHFVVERSEEGIDLEGLGSLLRHRRVSLGMQVTETARLAFISPPYMRKIENAVPDAEGRLAQPKPETLQPWVRALKWEDEPHIIVVFEMAGYRIESPTREFIPKPPKDPEKEELLGKVTDLLDLAYQRPGVWRETRDLLDPYLDYLKFRTTGVRETTVFKGGKRESLKGATESIDPSTLPDLLTVNEAARILRIAPLTLKRWGNSGRIVPVRINNRGDRRYKKEEIFQIINQQ